MSSTPATAPQPGPTLRLTQSADGDSQYRVEVALEGPGLSRQIASARFPFTFDEQDRNDLRWYLEDYLQYPLDPAPTIALGVERRIAAIGTELFKTLFQSSDDARDLWATLRTQLDETRVEIITGVREATAIPWELLRDPKTDVPLALRARSFVRAHPQPAQAPRLPLASDSIRILLVICRPDRDDDVPFRSVASRLIKGLSAEARAVFELDVLRPPTFAQLGRVLRAAKDAGTPYHVVHFDGHGMYGDANRLNAAAKRLMFKDTRPGTHGYLVFENPTLAGNNEYISGPELGKLLVEAWVPVLVLNACRSAHGDDGEAGDQGLETGIQESAAQAPDPRSSLPDPHAHVRALGSLAQEVMDAGVAGVVAMRYNVYVVTAAQFVADLYAALVRGSSLGEAVTLGRKQLAAQPLREIAYDPIRLQDWPVPVVYEATPIALFPRPVATPPLTIAIHAADAAPAQGALDPQLLKHQPDVGFFGRDETLLALDRAFDMQQIVLLWAYAGSGKTTTAAEFARWYALTGGIAGPVLFTSFEQYMPLPRVLDAVGNVFGGALEQAGIHWLALDDAARRAVALQVLAQVPVLWIWDNVEPVAGFPAGTDSPWSAAELAELADFLRAARDTRAKFLLTSRRDERSWLSELPARVVLPAMPMQERVQLARALAEKYARHLRDVEDWRPLLRFTQGNPLTITVLVGQALRDGLTTRAEIGAFVARLRAGEAAFADEASEGRAKSLGASLSYGFAHAFTEDERRQLALLHLFQGFVDVDALRVMGRPNSNWCLPEVRGLTREAGIALLDRAAEVGLLTAHGGGYYSIHPALPWYFKGLFERYYPSDEGRRTKDEGSATGDVGARYIVPSPTTNDEGTAGDAAGEGVPVSPRPRTEEGPGVRAMRAYVEAIGELGTYYTHQYNQGNREVISALDAEEPNLLHARQLARAHGWWRRVISTMQGLRTLYDHTGRRAEWARLVEEIVPDFVDPASGGPLPGREEQWGFVTEYRVWLAREARRWGEAERLQRVRVDWARQRAAATLPLPPETLDGAQRNTIRSLAVCLEQLGNIQREQGEPDCVRSYEEAIPLCQRIADKAEEAIVAINLGNAYEEIPTLRDLKQAEDWYRRSLELHDERDHIGQSQSLSLLGYVAFERFREVQAANKPAEEQLQHLNTAARSYHQALDLLPPNAVNDLAVAHNQLGVIYGNAGDLDRALSHYRESIRYKEAAGNIYGAALTRFNVAIALANAGRLVDARLYAQAALRNYATYGERAAADVQETQGLIEEIEQAMGER